jgi:phage/plasmid-like protein (TIGR03299 family)
MFSPTGGTQMDNIFGQRFASVRQPAWHALGTVLQKAVKPSVAVKRFGLDYRVSIEPMVVNVDGQSIAVGKNGIMRGPTADDPTWHYFGTVGEKYELVQNTDLGKIMDALAEVWGMETIGALDSGKTIFMTFKTGPQDIEGDAIEGYFLVVDVKDGGTTLKCAYTPVRVVCENTLRSGLRQATVAVSLKHLLGAKDQLAARVGLIKKARVAIDDTTAVFRQLARAHVTPSQANLMFDEVYPLPRVPEDAALVDWSEADLGAQLFKGVVNTMYDYNYYVKRAQDLRAGALQLYEKLNDEFPKLAGTAWHAWNAVVECADYREGGRAPEASALFGQRAREKKSAFDIAVRMAKINVTK